jgi:glycosyltransferase involved in cell wall biosynthesis
VPSQWLETGPLVVLEAFAAGTPVLGSNLGGIAELVNDGANGRLVPHDDLTAWMRALQDLERDRSIVARLRAGVRPPRTVREVSEDMQRVYARICSGSEAAAA